MHQAGAFNVTGATFVDLRAQTRTLAAVAAFRVMPATVSVDTQAIQSSSTTMTRDYAKVLGVRPAAGRLPSAEDFLPGGPAVVFLGTDLWQRLFNREGSAVGRTLLVNAAPRVIAGVLDVPASIPGASDLFLPYPDDAALLTNRRARLFTVVGRLAPDASIAAATSELDGVARRSAPRRRMPGPTSRCARPL